VRRIPELDGLRAVAALVIVVFHLNPPAFPAGWAGVDLFFVLSGYLITAIILKYRDAPGFIGRFYVRRGLRIWPIYYLVFLLLIAVNPWLPRPYPLDAWPYYATYTQNLTLYLRRPMPPFNPAFDHTWTLALEEQFYLVWPVLVILAGRRRLVALALAAIALAYAARAGFQSFLVVPVVIAPFSERLLIARCDGFALGGLLAALLDPDGPYVARPAAVRRVILGAGLLAVAYLGFHLARDGVGFLGLPTPPDPAGTILAIDVACFGLVGAVLLNLGRPLLAPLRHPVLVHLGLVSYGIYMYHYPIYWAVDGLGARDDFLYDQPWTIRALKVALTLIVALASWHLLERPILALKDRFAYRPADPGALQRR
jgi:peptidoglycan/LPS O-acetylase OafA/YrhL